MPVQRRVETQTGPTLAAASIVVVTMLVVIIPFALVLRTANLEPIDLTQTVRAGEITFERSEQRIQALTTDFPVSSSFSVVRSIASVRWTTGRFVIEGGF